eukprot:augustus_masked-scaffold_5-processed-gene-1.15-mRNA-1 protein AED:0.28 eAED:0.28 QI:0/-1/0/1/-1/1/1/0/338
MLFNKSSLDENAGYIAAGLGAVALGGLLFKFFKPSTTRVYEDPTSVGKEYDQWAADGVLEKFWGEHIHHGYFGEDGKDKVGSIKAKEILIEKLIEFASFVETADKVKNAKKSGSLKILDIGCGIGGSSRFLARWAIEKGIKVETYGVTLSDKQVERARQLSKQQGLQDNCFFQKADALALPFSDAEFDLVWSLESGEHMPDKEIFVKEAYRVLKPKGKLMIATWCTKEASELTEAEKRSLNIIYKEWALPFFVSMQEYERIFSNLGIKKNNVKLANWSTQTQKTWTQAVWDGFYSLHWILLQGPFVFFRTLKDVFAIYHMVKGFRKGYVIYGVHAVSK